MARRLRILLSAYFCSPYKGSESALGWNVASRLAKYHDVTLLCGDLAAEQPTRRDLARFTEEDGLPEGLHVHHVPPDASTRLIHHMHQLPGLWFIYYYAYKRWQKKAFREARRMHGERPFDLIHHLTVIGFREPGYLWQLDAPFFWGPVSGTPMVPKPFLKTYSFFEKLRWGSRNVMNAWQIRHPGRSRDAAMKAFVTWVVSNDDRIAIESWGGKPQQMLEVGSVGGKTGGGHTPISPPPIRLCWSGLFLGIKALPVLLHALAKLPAGSVTVDVLGDGPEAGIWKKLSADLGLAHCVRWRGMLSRIQAMEVMEECHMLVHTSVKEATATVVLEALERGLPVICHDACGMGTAVDERCGIKVPLRDVPTSIDGFSEAISRVIDDPLLLSKLRTGAIQRAGELSWEKKIDAILQAYQCGVSGNSIPATIRPQTKLASPEIESI